MSLYLTYLLYAIPMFVLLIIIEMIAAKLKGVEVNHSADMISSLSSGITNTTRDSLKFGVAIISYAWLVDHVTVIKLEPVWLAVIIAFTVQDFSGYWLHRMNHRVNVFWNRHIIHHSSEEFNLSCALRQSISDTFHFGAVFMIPAALLGIPASVFAIVGPIHLFMQFWYHTRLIDKMGWLEHIIVTPSHHRVHHAINPEYIDKNYGQIFIIWDKMFGSFQPELKEVEPVYGIIRPAGTWNPVIINFKHLWQLIKDAWHAEKWLDKLRIWFMPTGWRPEDVAQKFPIKTIENPADQVKYFTNNSKWLLGWSWLQLILTNVFMIHLFFVIASYDKSWIFLYAAFILMHVFSYTSVLDGKSYAVGGELAKLGCGVVLLYFQNLTWFGHQGIIVQGFVFYLVLSAVMTVAFLLKDKQPTPSFIPA